MAPDGYPDTAPNAAIKLFTETVLAEYRELRSVMAIKLFTETVLAEYREQPFSAAIRRLPGMLPDGFGNQQHITETNQETAKPPLPPPAE